MIITLSSNLSLYILGNVLHFSKALYKKCNRIMFSLNLKGASLQTHLALVLTDLITCFNTMRNNVSEKQRKWNFTFSSHFQHNFKACENLSQTNLHQFSLSSTHTHSYTIQYLQHSVTLCIPGNGVY